jgi:hypothetical protein
MATSSRCIDNGTKEGKEIKEQHDQLKAQMEGTQIEGTQIEGTHIEGTHIKSTH